MHGPHTKPISLKELASHLELSQSTVSRIINGGGTAHRIAKETQERVLQAAEVYGYSANSVARSLRQKRTYTVGVIVPEIGETVSTAILSGIEDELLKDGYFYFVVSHRHRSELLKAYPRMMVARSVEGIIAVDSAFEQELPIPLVAIAAQKRREGVIHIELHHEQAAELALEHLKSLGHSRIAFLWGHAWGPETDRRWQAIVEAAAKLGVEIDPRLVAPLKGREPDAALGMEATRELIGTGERFSAIFACNDAAAVGAMRALREAGLRVPEDVSVLGCDDLPLATASQPPLSTIQRPLRAMGQAAASTLLGLIRNDMPEPRPPLILVAPTLVARASTGRLPGLGASIPS